MAYDGARPADDDYISDGPGVIRDNTEALRTGQIVDAGTLKGRAPGNNSNNIPINNGTLCTNLNADKLDGSDASAFAGAVHSHNAASSSDNGFMSNTDKIKLDGIALGAEVNQNAFGTIYKSPGGPNIYALSKQDFITFIEGANISIVGNAGMRSLTIALTGVVPNASYASNANNASYLQGNAPSNFASAIHTSHTGEANSKGAFNGYKKFADGIIIQWGVVSVNAGVALWENWPIAFPNAIAVVIPTLQASSPTYAPAACGSFVLNGGYLYNPNNNQDNISYIAIGW